MGSTGVGPTSLVGNRSTSFRSLRLDIQREFALTKIRPQWNVDLDFGDRELRISDMDEPLWQDTYGDGTVETTYISEIGSCSVEVEYTPVPGAFLY